MKQEFETFRSIGPYEIGKLTQLNPSSLNGVDVVKYRITIEEIPEPTEVIQQRIQELWDNCNNWHQWEPLKREAKKYNYTLMNSPGNKLKKP